MTKVVKEITFRPITGGWSFTTHVFSRKWAINKFRKENPGLLFKVAEEKDCEVVPVVRTSELQHAIKSV